MFRGCLTSTRTEARRLQIATGDLIGQITLSSKCLLPLSSSVPHDVGQALDLSTDQVAGASLYLTTVLVGLVMQETKSILIPVSMYLMDD